MSRSGIAFLLAALVLAGAALRVGADEAPVFFEIPVDASAAPTAWP